MALVKLQGKRRTLYEAELFLPFVPPSLGDMRKKMEVEANKEAKGPITPPLPYSLPSLPLSTHAARGYPYPHPKVTTTTTTISFICMTITKYYSIAKAT